MWAAVGASAGPVGRVRGNVAPTAVTHRAFTRDQGPPLLDQSHGPPLSETRLASGGADAAGTRTRSPSAGKLGIRCGSTSPATTAYGTPASARMVTSSRQRASDSPGQRWPQAHRRL